MDIEVGGPVSMLYNCNSRLGNWKEVGTWKDKVVFQTKVLHQTVGPAQNIIHSILLKWQLAYCVLNCHIKFSPWVVLPIYISGSFCYILNWSAVLFLAWYTFLQLNGGMALV